MHERNAWGHGWWLLRMGLMPRDANASDHPHAHAYDADADANANVNPHVNVYADTDANAYINPDANAYIEPDPDPSAYINVNTDADWVLNLSGGNHMHPDLYLWAEPSGSLVVLRIGWIRRVRDDEYEALNMVTPKRGSYKYMFADAAIDGPPLDWTFTRPLPRPSPLNRFHILGPISLDPRQWASVCPKPATWVENEGDIHGQ